MSMSLSHLNTLGRKKHDKSQKKSFSRKLAFTFWGRVLSENWPRKLVFNTLWWVGLYRILLTCILVSYILF